jgi:TPR repeat protein
MRLLEGSGVEQDVVKSAEYRKLSADQRYAGAQVSYGSSQRTYIYI